MANKKAENNRYSGRPGIFDTADDGTLKTFYIRQTRLRVEGQMMTTIRVEAIESAHYWRGWRHGVARGMHPAITWKKAEWELAPVPSPTPPPAEGKIPDAVPRKKAKRSLPKKTTVPDKPPVETVKEEVTQVSPGSESVPVVAA